MYDKLSYLLLQVRKAGDPMAQNEIESFARSLHCRLEQITAFDLLNPKYFHSALKQADVVLLGGSGDYSLARGGDWLEAALEMMRDLYELSKPTFASCWGFQAMARAMGGTVICDLERAELGSHPVFVTEAGRRDPVFGVMGDSFLSVMGHQDIVTVLPAEAVLLASSERVENQAFCFLDKPIYCTQFHPELLRDDLRKRMERYPEYVETIAGVSLEELMAASAETPDGARLLSRFIEIVFG